LLAITLTLYIAIAFITDMKHSVIPNYLSVGAAIIGLGLQSAISGGDGFMNALLGFAAGFGLLLPLYIFKAVGAGDVKLFGGIGALTGMSFVLSAIVYALMLAGIIGIGMLIFRRELWRRLARWFQKLRLFMYVRDVGVLEADRPNAKLTFPFMYAVAPAVLLSFVESQFVLG